MNRQHVALAAIALLSVLALSVAAANLDATAESSPGVGVGSSEIGIGSDEEFSFGGPAPQPQEESSVSPFYRLLSQLVGVFIIVGAVVGIVVLYRDYGIKGPLSVFGVGIFLAVLLYFLLQGAGSTFAPAPAASETAGASSFLVAGAWARWTPRRLPPSPQFRRRSPLSSASCSCCSSSPTRSQCGATTRTRRRSPAHHRWT
ncbi:hypothetical protein [Haladaptatus sp. GCM10025893]|uniref:hypothetical protein n=1 Tax=Haladaptatus sp. GCM10025893 TaxID=3252659 RepID=UPI00361F4642